MISFSYCFFFCFLSSNYSGILKVAQMQHFLPLLECFISPFVLEVSLTAPTPSSRLYLINSYLLFKFQSTAQYTVHLALCYVLECNGDLKRLDSTLLPFSLEQKPDINSLGSHYLSFLTL